MPSRTKHRSRPLPAAKAPGSPATVARLWAFRLMAVFLVPVVLFLALETGLRVAGLGHATSFFLKAKIDKRDCLVENDRFGWRFFGPDMARSPVALVLPKSKPPDTIRVFVFGESAALGDPQPEFGLSRMLQALLEGRYPDRHFEVINTAMTAINSHVIYVIAKECASHQGDFWVVYMGNNEVVGPYGSGTVFGEKAAALPIVRASIALKGMYAGQWLDTLLGLRRGKSLEQSEWGGMVMFAHNHVRADDPRMPTIYHNFELNLRDIIDAGLGSGAKVVVCTVARNLKECGPFASEHRSSLSDAVLSQWNGYYQEGLAAQQAGRTSEAITAFHSANQVDNTFAETHFRLGQCLLQAGENTESAREFISACDQDALRFRADSRINDIIRKVASERQSAGVDLLDCESLVNQHSANGLAGDEYFYEHVHFNFEGNYLVARSLAEGLKIPGSESAGSRPWPSEEDCARRLAWNDFTRRAGLLEIFGRYGEVPFNTQADSRRQVERLRHQIELLQSAVQPEALHSAVAQTKAAAAANPRDWILLQNLARLQEQTGDTTGAVESLRGVTQSLPYNGDAWQGFGLALAADRKYDEAAAAFECACKLRPENVASLNSLAESHASAGLNAQAVREYREVLRRKPYWGPAHFGLGKLLDATGHTNEAKDEFDLALKYRIRTPAAANALGALCVAKGWYDRAVENYTESLRLVPADPIVHFNLGYCLAKLGRSAEAKAQFQEAIRLNPSFAEAHFSLGLALAQEGDTAGGASEFGEAVRLKPEFVPAHLNFGIALVNENHYQEALDQFEAALSREPNNPIALKYVALLRAAPADPAKP